MNARLKAHSISRPVWERLSKGSSAAQVTSVFERVCNLSTADGQLIALVLPQVGDGPLNIVAEARRGCFSGLTSGMMATLGADKLCVAELEIDLEPAIVWEPIPDWVNLRDELDAIEKRLLLLESMALRHACEGSLLSVLTSQVAEGPARAESFEAPSTVPDVVSGVAREATRLLRGGWRGDVASLQEGASLLAGLGGGTTPAGDDFLTGAMVWAWLSHPKPASLCQRLLQAARHRTTSLSAALLEVAARGECNAAWHMLLAALSQGSDAELGEAVQGVLSHGATSGADALAGFLWAGISMSPGPSRSADPRVRRSSALLP